MSHQKPVENFTLILGLGLTGLSCVKFFQHKHIPYRIMDNRKCPPKLDDYLKTFSSDVLKLGVFDEQWLKEAKEIIISPGLAKDHAVLRKYHAKMISDIELFQRYNSKPVIAITGSNGKSTVTALLAHMTQMAGKNVAFGANFGIPVLDLLIDKPSADFYIFELSSFQLETTHQLKTFASTILNIVPDHMDRYSTFESYANAKRRIYKNCQVSVINLDEPWIWKAIPLQKVKSFSLYNAKADFYLTKKMKEVYITTKQRHLLSIADLKIKGIHNAQNALAAMALGDAMGLPIEPMVQALKIFGGLPHRCQWIRTLNQVDFYNDSKATNVASTLAALQGFGQIYQKKNIILIAGGQGKGGDFSLLNESVTNYVKSLILIGEDAEKIDQSINANATVITHADSLKAAILNSVAFSRPGDIILLSPACASFDQFKNFEDRGNQFTKAVLSLT
jgi:UDP-N-acetylmuramoylalanine--D-glutamate ligase